MTIKYRQWRSKKFCNISDLEYQRSLIDSGKMEEIFLLLVKDAEVITRENYFTHLKSTSSKTSNYLLFALKNSGEASNFSKRAQLKNNIQYTENEAYYIVGFYNTGDNIVMTFTDNVEKSIKRAVRGKAYSSFWFELNEIVNADLHKISVSEKENKPRIVYLSADSLKENKNIIYSLLSIKNSDTVAIKTESLKRMKLRNECFNLAKYKCEICSKSHTFITPEGTNYFEAHHMIPYNFTTVMKVNKNIDVIENLICLCPECHKKIHYSEEMERFNTIQEVIKLRPFLLNHFMIDLETLKEFYSLGDNDGN